MYYLAVFLSPRGHRVNVRVWSYGGVEEAKQLAAAQVTEDCTLESCAVDIQEFNAGCDLHHAKPRRSRRKEIRQ